MVLLYTPLPVWRQKAKEPGDALPPNSVARPEIPLDETVQEKSAAFELPLSYQQVQQDYQLERRTFL